jgi:hypothetical protein
MGNRQMDRSFLSKANRQLAIGNWPLIFIFEKTNPGEKTCIASS